MYAYIQGLNKDGDIVFVGPSHSFFTPQAPSSSYAPVKIAESSITIQLQHGPTHLIIPGELTSGRVYLAEQPLQFAIVRFGNDSSGLVTPDATNEKDASMKVPWGFAEFTFSEKAGLILNPSYVDFAPPLALELSAEGSTKSTTQVNTGLPVDGLARICDMLKAQAAIDGQPWDQLCIRDQDAGKILRVVSPNIRRYQMRTPGRIQNSSNIFDGYFESYVGEVWQHYASQPGGLTFDTQSPTGDILCTMQGDVFNCDHNAGTISKPSTGDILTCSEGQLANVGTDEHKSVVARMCAAFVRSTIMPSKKLPDMKTARQPSNDIKPNMYYTNDVCNHYSRIIHSVLPGKRGYAFPYDDVNPPEPGNQTMSADGIISVRNPEWVKITIGGRAN
ncbi:Hypothetical predicted protein [Lecanosticta acicola]|uniref:GH64 domain-containing protein n=1 Tax=Lecanosticta acicola TaxID=111012 RepID=A0AAI8YWV9_9PEZI|nr:Hypothetical predicted protein [Lecanosticta acicola]